MDASKYLVPRFNCDPVECLARKLQPSFVKPTTVPAAANSAAIRGRRSSSNIKTITSVRVVEGIEGLARSCERLWMENREWNNSWVVEMYFCMCTTEASFMPIEAPEKGNCAIHLGTGKQRHALRKPYCRPETLSLAKDSRNKQNVGETIRANRDIDGDEQLSVNT